MRIVALGDRDLSYLTHREIDATLALLPDDVDCGWVSTDTGAARDVGSADGVWLLPGTPYRNDDVAYAARSGCGGRRRRGPVIRGKPHRPSQVCRGMHAPHEFCGKSSRRDRVSHDVQVGWETSQTDRRTTHRFLSRR